MTEDRAPRPSDRPEPDRGPVAPVEGPSGIKKGPPVGLEATPEAALGIEAPEAPAELAAVYEAGLEIKARSQWALARRRFFRHRLAMASLVVLFLIFGAGIFADKIAPYEYDAIDLQHPGIGPTFQAHHFFGTDTIGRDYFTRVVFGIRTSVRVALIVAILSTIIGVLIGAIAGYFGGWVDNLLMRFTDLVLTLPILAVLLIATALLGRGSQYRVAIILALFFWPSLARIIRANFLSLREKEFVEAAKALGASDRRIIFRHMLPNSLSPIIVSLTLTVAIAILIESTLSFLGFGVQPPTPALGTLIDDGKGQMLDLWWLVVFPGLTIVLICLCINFVGDGMRDALDPTQRRVRA